MLRQVLRRVPPRGVAAFSAAAFGAASAPNALAEPRDINRFKTFTTDEGPRGASQPSAASTGEISTHVISKLGKGTVDGASVKVYYNPNMSAGPLTSGWTMVAQAKLSANGGVDDLVPPGTLKCGLYMIEFDFEKMDSAARQIFRKDAEGYVALNPAGFFLAAHSTITLKIEDDSSLNHLVLSVGDKEITARPGVRAH